jgi:vacuolar-type H+-ATPase catalytic subunit A/Vma1
MKSKTTGDVYDALKLFLNEHTNIGSITSDNESAFKSSDVQELLRENNIQQIMVDVGEHKSLGVIDRSIRTIKEKIYQYFKYKNTTKYIDKLENIINGHNNNPHRGLNNLTPNEVIKEKKASEEIIELNTTKDEDNFKKVKSMKINIGDAVRIKKVKGKYC